MSSAAVKAYVCADNKLSVYLNAIDSACWKWGMGSQGGFLQEYKKKNGNGHMKRVDVNPYMMLPADKEDLDYPDNEIANQAIALWKLSESLPLLLPHRVAFASAANGFMRWRDNPLGEWIVFEDQITNQKVPASRCTLFVKESYQLEDLVSKIRDAKKILDDLSKNGPLFPCPSLDMDMPDCYKVPTKEDSDNIEAFCDVVDELLQATDKHEAEGSLGPPGSVLTGSSKDPYPLDGEMTFDEHTSLLRPTSKPTKSRASSGLSLRKLLPSLLPGRSGENSEGSSARSKNSDALQH